MGGLIALPALRLRGLYLALATLAFGVFVSDMIIADIAPHVLPIFHLNYSIFPNGTLQIPALKLGPIDLSSSKTFLTASTCIFILIGIGLIALRRSNYGRRLTAMKDSPAAAATLGQNLIKLKLSVFMISAAIAGLGGVLLSSATVNVSATPSSSSSAWPSSCSPSSEESATSPAPSWAGSWPGPLSRP